MGGIDATATTALTAEEMYRYARELLDEVRARAGGFHKFILGTGDATAKGTPLENLHAISRAVADVS